MDAAVLNESKVILLIRRKTTKELLGESIHELAKIKPVDKITVKEITDNCGVAPSTFYRHFRDKYELVAWIYNYQMEDIYMDFCNGSESWREVVRDMAVILDNDRSFYSNALINTTGPNAFFYATRQRSVELLTDLVKKENNGEISAQQLFDISFYLWGISCSITEWFLTKLPYSVEQITDYVYKAMPGSLKAFLI